MNPALIALARYTRDLLVYDENLIQFGRTNEELTTTTTSFIVLDELSADAIGQSRKFDPDAEVMTYSERTVGRMTVNFYGDDAYTNARNFKVLINSQLSRDLQRKYGIQVFSPSSITDIRFISGTQQSPRYEMELNVQYNEAVNVDTLRIDTAQFEFLNDQ